MCKVSQRLMYSLCSSEITKEQKSGNYSTSAANLSTKGLENWLLDKLANKCHLLLTKLGGVSTGCSDDQPLPTPFKMPLRLICHLFKYQDTINIVMFIVLRV